MTIRPPPRRPVEMVVCAPRCSLRLRSKRRVSGSGCRLAVRSPFCSRLTNVFGLANGEPPRGDSPRCSFLGLGGQRQQRPGMAHLECAGLEKLGGTRRKVQQSQHVADCGPRPTDRRRQGFVRERELREQRLERPRFLQRCQILALDVLDQRHGHGLAVIDIADHHGHVRQPRAFGGTPAAFAGDDFEAARRTAGGQRAAR